MNAKILSQFWNIGSNQITDLTVLIRKYIVTILCAEVWDQPLYDFFEQKLAENEQPTETKNELMRDACGFTYLQKLQGLSLNKAEYLFSNESVLVVTMAIKFLIKQNLEITIQSLNKVIESVNLNRQLKIEGRLKVIEICLRHYDIAILDLN